MADFNTFIPAAFPALALAHFVALLSPGQDFFLIAGHAIRHKLRGSFYICLGVAIGNAVYIAIAVLGWSGIRDDPLIFTIIEIMGACYLLWVGIHLLKSQTNVICPNTIVAPRPKATKQFALGLYSALLNPKNALFYMSLMTVILGNKVTLTQQAFCGIWMVFAVFFWDILIAKSISQHKIQRLLNQRIHLVERGAGAVLISFAVGLFVQSSYGF